MGSRVVNAKATVGDTIQASREGLHIARHSHVIVISPGLVMLVVFSRALYKTTYLGQGRAAVNASLPAGSIDGAVDSGHTIGGVVPRLLTVV